MHAVNEEAVNFFFILNERTINTSIIRNFLKQTLATGNKMWIGYNTGKNILMIIFIVNDGQKYMMNVIDESISIEQTIKDFQKTAPSSIFGDYLSLNAAMDTNAFCNLTDTYNYYQTLRISYILNKYSLP